MQPAQGELVIILTSEQAEALGRGLAALMANPATSETKALQEIQEKLKAARAKML